jgi:phage-related protein
MSAINFNGKTYNNLEEMPANERAAYEQLAKIFVDKNGNGIPDFMEGDMVRNVMTAFTSNVNFNGQMYNNLNELPPDVRAKVQGAFDKLAGLGILTNSPAMMPPISNPPVSQEPMAISQPFFSHEYTPAIQEGKGSNLMIWVIAGLAVVLCLAATVAGIYFFMMQ